jgi:hypothetical protein
MTLLEHETLSEALWRDREGCLRYTISTITHVELDKLAC